MIIAISIEDASKILEDHMKKEFGKDVKLITYLSSSHDKSMIEFEVIEMKVKK
jgi:hypothetical protein